MATRLYTSKRILLHIFLGTLALLFNRAGLATSVIPLDFDQLVANSELAIEARVVDLQPVLIGNRPFTATLRKVSTVPVAEPKPELADGDPPHPISSPPSDVPESLAVEGGQMLFTDVTLAVDRLVFGSVQSLFTIRIAGGVYGETQVIVAGMPRFELNERYLLFLQPDYDTVADPVTGVNQGFFRIVGDPKSGVEMLLNVNGDIVIAVENKRLVVRHNPSTSRSPVPNRVPAPQPESGVVMRAEESVEVARYWTSMESPIAVDDFAAAVIAKKGSAP